MHQQAHRRPGHHGLAGSVDPGEPHLDGAPRQLRVGEQVRHVLAELLMRGDVHDPVLANASLTVTEVRMSRDLRRARVFVTELGGGQATLISAPEGLPADRSFLFMEVDDLSLVAFTLEIEDASGGID